MSAGNFTNKPGIKGEYNYIRGLACPSWSGSILAGGYKVCVSSLSKCDILVCPVSPYSPSLIARSFPSPPGRGSHGQAGTEKTSFFYPVLISATLTLLAVTTTSTNIHLSSATFITASRESLMFCL